MTNKRPVWERKLIYMVRAGSHAYGMATPESDVDLRGICLLDKENLLGHTHFATYDPKDSDNDLCIYSLPKYLDLALTCNPNVIELLAVADEDVLFIDSMVEHLRSNINLFLTKKARHSFSGYAFSQLQRIQRHRSYLLDPPTEAPKRSDFGLPEHRSVLNKEELNAYMWLTTQLLKQAAAGSKLSQATREELEEIDWVGMVQSADLPENSAPILEDLTGMTKELIRAVLEQKYGYDCKHASHLCRLYKMGIEILEGKGVIVKRPDAEWLLSIRQGAMTYEELLEWMDQKEKEMEEADANSMLPHHPDREAVEKIQIDFLESGFAYQAPLQWLYDHKIFGENYTYTSRTNDV